MTGFGVNYPQSRVKKTFILVFRTNIVPESTKKYPPTISESIFVFSYFLFFSIVLQGHARFIESDLAHVFAFAYVLAVDRFYD